MKILFFLKKKKKIRPAAGAEYQKTTTNERNMVFFSKKKKKFNRLPESPGLVFRTCLVDFTFTMNFIFLWMGHHVEFVENLAHDFLASNGMFWQHGALEF